MARVVNLEKGGVVKKGFVGFSWTTLFFGFLVPLFRGDVKWFIIMLIIGIFSVGLGNIILCFLYNKFYTTNLLEQGYVPADDYSRNILKEKNLIK